MKRFRGQISYIFNRQNSNVLPEICSAMAPTTQSMMMTKIVHHNNTWLRRNYCRGPTHW